MVRDRARGFLVHQKIKLQLCWRGASMFSTEPLNTEQTPSTEHLKDLHMMMWACNFLVLI